MPKITIENKKKIINGFYEIETKTYELPSTVIYNSEPCYYSTYHKAYLSRGGDVYISAEDYVKELLGKIQKMDKDNGREK